MAWSFATERAKVFQVVSRHFVSREVQHGVLQSACMPIGQNEAIAIDPGRVGWTVGHYFVPKKMRHGSHAHGSTRMARLGGLRLIGRHGANRIDTLALQLGTIVDQLCFYHFAWLYLQ